ncbi:whey acidic protein-like [Prionailurus viverrinus]|uniref:whey acidic protein-like n=1 Tax=Prionailurus viverrinus TaxID=61388 RepID=UPI001FF29517|nr:whey acidic protein-like [Prionailurus viverrinus]
MHCLASLALVLLALEAAVALAAAPAFTVPGQAMCPELSSSEEDSCVVSCSTDDDCPQGIRCCPGSPCSRSCVFPVMAPLQKAGRCPRVPVPLAPEPCSESTECSVDSQCAGSRKCCFSTCAMRCLDPATGDLARELGNCFLATCDPTFLPQKEAGLLGDAIEGTKNKAVGDTMCQKAGANLQPPPDNLAPPPSATSIQRRGGSS